MINSLIGNKTDQHFLSIRINSRWVKPLVFLLFLIIVYFVYSSVTKGYFLYVDDYKYVFPKETNFLRQAAFEMSWGRPGFIPYVLRKYLIRDILMANFCYVLEY